MRLSLFALSSWLLVLYTGCTPLQPVPGEPGAGQSPGRIYITDRRGEQFDITHAVNHYGMSRHGFEYGIGKNAIRPLNHPGMIGPGQMYYPSPRDIHQFIGTEIDGDVRSYPITPLVRHEVVNETIGATQAAVAY